MKKLKFQYLKSKNISLNKNISFKNNNSLDRKQILDYRKWLWEHSCHNPKSPYFD